MSQLKSTKKATVTPKATLEDDSMEESEATATVLSAGQKGMLEKAGRFLVNIATPQFAPRAKRGGYTTEAHAEGWELYNKAAGADRPLEHWFAESEHVVELNGITGDRLRLLTEIDTFENIWFPRVRAILRRKVPRQSREAFAAAFFTNLAQQPLGPGVVGSVATLLLRVEGLAKSKQPGAKEVLATLKERGLTAKKIEQVRALLKEAEEGATSAPRKEAVTAAELAKAQAEQLEAFEDLRDWFNDWATHLRTVFNVRHQIILGLTVRSGRTANAPDDVSDGAEPDNASGAEAGEEPPAAKPAAAAKPR